MNQTQMNDTELLAFLMDFPKITHRRFVNLQPAEPMTEGNTPTEPPRTESREIPWRDLPYPQRRDYVIYYKRNIRRTQEELNKANQKVAYLSGLSVVLGFLFATAIISRLF